MEAKILNNLAGSVLLAAALTSAGSAATISVNLVAIPTDDVTPDPAILAPSEMAGVEAAQNWNNWELSKIGTAIAAPKSLTNLVVDNQGSPVTSSTSVTYSQTANHGIFSGATYDYSPSDEKIFRRYVHQFGDNRTSSYTITGLTSAFTGPGYELIVYVGATGNGITTRIGSVELDEGDDASVDQTLYFWEGGANADFDNGPGYVEGKYLTAAAAEAAANLGENINTIRFGGLTDADLSFTVAPINGPNADRAAVYGFQIVAIPEPATGMIAAAGMILSIVRRRRHA